MIDDKKIEEAFDLATRRVTGFPANQDSPMHGIQVYWFKAGYLAAMEEMKNHSIGFCDSCDEFTDLGCSPYFPGNQHVCERCHIDEDNNGEDTTDTRLEERVRKIEEFLVL